MQEGPLPVALLSPPLDTAFAFTPKSWCLSFQRPGFWIHPHYSRAKSKPQSLLCKWIIYCFQPAPARSPPPPPPNWFNLLIPESWAGLERQKPTHQWRRLINDRECRSWIGSDPPLPVIWVSERTFSAPLQSLNPVLYGEKVDGLIRPICLSNLPKPQALDRNSQHSDLSTGHS